MFFSSIGYKVVPPVIKNIGQQQWGIGRIGGIGGIGAVMAAMENSGDLRTLE